MATAAKNSFDDVKRELLAKLLQAEGITVDGQIPRRGHRQAPLSFSQQRMWFMDQMEPGTPVFNLCFGVRMKGTLDVTALVRTLHKVVERHEVLRSGFELREDGPVQVIDPRTRLEVPVHDLCDLPEEEREAAFLAKFNEEQQTPFNLQRAPLIRVKLMRLAADEHVLITTMHHIISDGWSSGVLLNEFVAGYAAYHAGHEPILVNLPIQYSDYAAWQREWLAGDILRRQVEYWKKQLAGAPAGLDLPLDFPRPAIQTSHGKRQLLMLPQSLSAAVRTFAAQMGVTPFMLLLGTFQLLMARYSGQRDVLVGTPVAGRQKVETEPLIGAFVNPVVMRCRLDGNPTVREFLGQVREVTLDAFAHQDLPFEKLVEELQPVRDLSRTPLFQVMFILLNTPGGELVLPDLAVSEVASEKLISEYELTITLSENQGRLGGSLEYNSDLFTPATAQRIVEHYRKLLEGVCGNPDARIFELPLLTEEERRRAVYAWNHTARPQPADPVHRRFEVQARNTPDHIAVSCGAASLDYASLNARANQLARQLQAEGVGPDVLVGVCLTRSVDTMVALLAVLKSGGAYVPIDPEYPRERVEFMLADAGVRVLLTHESLLGRIASAGKVIALDRDWPAIAAHAPENLNTSSAPTDLAYVIYTSGSTGKPKGVMIPHSALSNFLESMAAEPGLKSTDVLLAITTLSFDIAGLEMYLPLIQGGRIEMATREECIDGRLLAEKIEQCGITVMQATPATWRLLFETGWNGKQDLKALVGGESVSRELAQKLLERVGEVWNVYGPTETTIWSATCRLSADDSAISIGRPIANTTLYVLDAQMEPVPAGVVGEIYIGGAGLARGYLNRPELTAERFVPDPLREDVAAKMYRTGDLGRYLPDGRIECLGRVDHQVKIRGHRIELGEIEAVLAEYPGIQQNVIDARDDQLGGKRLVAFVVGDERRLKVSEITAFLKRRIPEFMIPNAFVFLPALPLTPNGKIDRKALPQGDAVSAKQRASFVAPATNLQRDIAAVWAAVLKLERVGVHDNFFELGGHSLLLARVHSELRRRLDRDVSILDLFRYPTVAALAEFMAATSVQPQIATAAQERAELRRRMPSRRSQKFRAEETLQPKPSSALISDHEPVAANPRPAAAPPTDSAKRKLLDQLLAQEGVHASSIPRRQSNGPAALSPMQRRLWFLDQLEPGNASYKVQGSLPIRGALNYEVLRRSIAAVVERHESLRTVFALLDGKPVQVVVSPPDIQVPLLADLSNMPEADLRAKYATLLENEINAPFDLKTGPLLRVGLIRLGSEHHVLVISIHHLVSDGWSLRIFTREVAAWYDSLITGRECLLSPLPIQYADFSQWQLSELDGGALQSQLNYWREKLGAHSQVLELPADSNRGDHHSGKGVVHYVDIDRELTSRLQGVCRSEKASLFMIMLAAFKILMSRLAGQESIAVGVPVAGRSRKEVENLIGFFVNTLVLRTDLDGNPTFLEVLRRVRETALGAQARQEIPFEMLVEELHPERSVGRNPLFQVFFNMVNLPPVEPPGEFGGIVFEPFIPVEAQAKFDLTLYVTEDSQRTRLSMLYPEGLFKAERVQEMMSQYCRLLDQVVDDPGRQISEYSLVTPRAKDVLPDARLALPSGSDEVLPQQLSRVARSAGNRMAVRDPVEEWTYADLESCSNRLAHALNRRGIGKGDAVAIYARRRAAIVWALLAVIKSGAAFVLVDSSLPAAHCAAMVRVARPRCILNVAASGELPGDIVAALGSPADVISLPALAEAGRGGMLSDLPDTFPKNAITPDDISYITFTSGTTSQPKAIVGTHRPLSHFLAWHARRHSLTEADRFSMLSGLGHDPLLRDILTPLWVGASLHMIDADDRTMPLKLVSWAAREKISAIHLTPQLLGVLTHGAQQSGGQLPDLRYLFLGGDVLQRTAAASVRDFACNARIVSFYGTTETPQGIAYHQLNHDANGSGIVPLGRGIDGVQLLVLNKAGNLTGIGECGEIHVRSPFLAKGYVDEALTRQRFLPNPATGDSEDRIYKSGDLGRYSLDGEVEFVGRGDHEVKVRGNRVDIAAVEAELSRHPEVHRCVVTGRGASDGELRLIGYFIPRTGAMPEPAGLRAYLQTRLPAYMVPAAFIGVPEIRLTANGKVDVEALPDFEAALKERSLFVPAADEFEAKIADIWKRVLNVPRVGREDDFFDLGGHSLLANRLLTEIEREFGHTLPVATLFEASTVARFAEVMRSDGWTAPYSSLVRIKDKGSAAPFVCVHSLGANLVSYAALARRLGDRQPFYGLQPVGLDGSEQPHTRVEEMAAHYIRELKQVQPAGPYYLGGVCLGGVVAFEMAQRLVGEGEEVGALVLIDTFCPGAPRYLPRHPDPFGLVQHIDWYAGEVLMRSWSERLPYLRTRIANVGKRAARIGRTLAGKVIPTVEIRKGTTETNLARVKQLNSRAWGRYVPRPYPGKITLLWCSETPTRCYRDRRLAWSEFAEEGLEVHMIPGNHMSMVESPHADVMAEILGRCLQRAQQEHQQPKEMAAHA